MELFIFQRKEKMKFNLIISNIYAHDILYSIIVSFPRWCKFHNRFDVSFHVSDIRLFVLKKRLDEWSFQFSKWIKRI